MHHLFQSKPKRKNDENAEVSHFSSSIVPNPTQNPNPKEKLNVNAVNSSNSASNSLALFFGLKKSKPKSNHNKNTRNNNENDSENQSQSQSHVVIEVNKEPLQVVVEKSLFSASGNNTANSLGGERQAFGSLTNRKNIEAGHKRHMSVVTGVKKEVVLPVALPLGKSVRSHSTSSSASLPFSYSETGSQASSFVRLVDESVPSLIEPDESIQSLIANTSFSNVNSTHSSNNNSKVTTPETAAILVQVSSSSSCSSSCDETRAGVVIGIEKCPLAINSPQNTPIISTTTTTTTKKRMNREGILLLSSSSFSLTQELLLSSSLSTLSLSIFDYLTGRDLMKISSVCNEWKKSLMDQEIQLKWNPYHTLKIEKMKRKVSSCPIGSLNPVNSSSSSSSFDTFSSSILSSSSSPSFSSSRLFSSTPPLILSGHHDLARWQSFFTLITRECHLPIVHYMNPGSIQNVSGNFTGDLTIKMRSMLIDWLLQVSIEFNNQPETIQLATRIIDAFFSSESAVRATVQLVGVTSLLMSAKLHERHYPDINELLFLCDGIYTRPQLLSMESHIMMKLNYKIFGPTILSFLQTYYQEQDLPLSAKHYCQYLTELLLLEYDAAYLLPHIVAAGIYIVSASQMGIGYERIVEFVGTEKEKEIGKVVILLGRVIKAAPEATLQFVYKRWSVKERSAVASNKINTRTHHAG